MEEIKLPMAEAIKKVREWALANGFEERNGVGYCRRLPFGFAYVDFKGEEATIIQSYRGYGVSTDDRRK